MQILVSIDDTDNIDSRGTGELASLIAQAVEENGWGASSFVTRHQLYVHPDIPYTSHNSSMCFAADIEEGCLDKVISYAANFLATESAEGSDPGLCVAVVDRLNAAPVIDFGKKAKTDVLTIDDAYRLAEELGVHLSEHGGTGQGVIGALAGIGLRLWGSDGKLKGKLKVETADGLITVADLCGRTPIEEVQTFSGEPVDDQTLIRLGDWIKPVFLEGKTVLLVVPAEEGMGAAWQTCSKQQLKGF